METQEPSQQRISTTYHRPEFVRCFHHGRSWSTTAGRWPNCTMNQQLLVQQPTTGGRVGPHPPALCSNKIGANIDTHLIRCLTNCSKIPMRTRKGTRLQVYRGQGCTRVQKVEIAIKPPKMFVTRIMSARTMNNQTNVARVRHHLVEKSENAVSSNAAKLKRNAACTPKWSCRTRNMLCWS